MKQILQRIMSDTPAFFKKLQIFGATLIGVKAALLPITGLPPMVGLIATKIAIVGAVIVAVSQLAATTPPAA